MTSTRQTPGHTRLAATTMALATLSCSALFAPNTQAKMLYVTTTGNDSITYANNSATQPWRTITKAGKSALAGDTVNIGAGTYNQPLKVLNSGTASARIVFKTTSGNRDVYVQRYTVDIAGKNYITIRDLLIQNVYQSGTGNSIGIAISGPSTGVQISNNLIVNTTGSGIAAWGTGDAGRTATYDYKGIKNLVIENNILFNTVIDGYNEAITLANGVDTFFIRNNTLARSANIPNDHGGEAIDIKEGASNGYIYGNTISQYNQNMIYLDGGGREDVPGQLNYAASNPPKLKNINIYNNKIYKNDGGYFNAIMLASEGHGSIDGVKIYNNVIRNNGANGVLVFAHPAMRPDATISNVFITNNSFYDNGIVTNDTGWNYSADINIATGSDPAVTARFQNIVVRNNASFKSTGPVQRGIWIDEPSIVTYSNNSDTTVQDNQNSVLNPYTNAAGGDLTLKVGSPAIDQGAPVGIPGVPSADITGAARPKGKGVDIGAYESF